MLYWPNDVPKLPVPFPHFPMLLYIIVNYYSNYQDTCQERERGILFTSLGDMVSARGGLWFQLRVNRILTRQSASTKTVGMEGSSYRRWLLLVRRQTMYTFIVIILYTESEG